MPDRPTPLDIIMAQAAAVRDTAEAIRKQAEALILTCDSLEQRMHGGDDAARTLTTPPIRPPQAVASPPAIPASPVQSAPSPRLLTFDDPAPAPVPAPAGDSSPNADSIQPDKAGDLRPNTR